MDEAEMIKRAEARREANPGKVIWSELVNPQTWIIHAHGNKKADSDIRAAIYAGRKVFVLDPLHDEPTKGDLLQQLHDDLYAAQRWPHQTRHVDNARVRLSDYRAGLVAPEGYRLVPIEPTEAMAAAAVKAHFENPAQINGLNYWRAMLGAVS